jgi:hypothetical protein
MDDLHIVWIGSRGVGKKTALHKALAHVAQSRKVGFAVKPSIWSIENAKKMQKESEATTAEEDEVEVPNKGNEKDIIPYETSNVHLGFDIARMSMQDKTFIGSILERLGYGTEVAVGKKKTCVKRILVFYHAHLLSHDSVLQLQMALEQYEGSLAIWCTSELPLSYELSDWFVEIPLGGKDHTLEEMRRRYVSNNHTTLDLLDWDTYFKDLIKDWSQKPMNLSRVQEVRDWVYFCLLRNLRWQEVIQYILDALLQSKLPKQKILDTITVLIQQQSTGGGQTLPSYRIPIAWENLGLGIAKTLSIK